jgi:hypothetical protein
VNAYAHTHECVRVRHSCACVCARARVRVCVFLSLSLSLFSVKSPGSDRDPQRGPAKNSPPLDEHNGADTGRQGALEPRMERHHYLKSLLYGDWR